MATTNKLVRRTIFTTALIWFASSACQIVFADSSSPLLAAYYDRQMAIVKGDTYFWTGNNQPQRLPFEAVQVGVSQSHFFVLNKKNSLLRFEDDHRSAILLMRGIKKFASGNSGVLAVTNRNQLFWISNTSDRILKIADGVSSAVVGDGANYYIENSGALFVKGKAHRGQYGDGRLISTDHFVQTANNIRQISAHTGHALILKLNGQVFGTGGNIFGPVGKHGLGDKAVRWSKIVANIRAIATGASHSLAIRQDNSLLVWGREYGVEPVIVMNDVAAVAAGTQTTLALKIDGSLWQWEPGQKPQQLRLIK